MGLKLNDKESRINYLPYHDGPIERERRITLILKYRNLRKPWGWKKSDIFERCPKCNCISIKGRCKNCNGENHDKKS